MFGYYIEVTKSYYDLVPAEYIRKQTLANAERFITDELKKAEEEISGASEHVLVLEAEILRRFVTLSHQSLQRCRRPLRQWLPLMFSAPLRTFPCATDM